MLNAQAKGSWYLIETRKRKKREPKKKKTGSGPRFQTKKPSCKNVEKAISRPLAVLAGVLGCQPTWAIYRGTGWVSGPWDPIREQMAVAPNSNGPRALMIWNYPSWAAYSLQSNNIHTCAMYLGHLVKPHGFAQMGSLLVPPVWEVPLTKDGQKGFTTERDSRSCVGWMASCTLVLFADRGLGATFTGSANRFAF